MYQSKRMMKYFIGSTFEIGQAPERRDGHYVYNMVENMKVTYGKMKKDGKINKRDTPLLDGMPSKNMLILFKYPPYWLDLAMRHSIDGMHIKKNVFESVIGILIDIKAKTKDGLMSWEDLVRLESRSELHPEDLGNGRHYLPAASYNLTNDEKEQSA